MNPSNERQKRILEILPFQSDGVKGLSVDIIVDRLQGEHELWNNPGASKAANVRAIQRSFKGIA